MRGGSFTESVVAELAPHLPPLPHCRSALLEGMGLTRTRRQDRAWTHPRRRGPVRHGGAPTPTARAGHARASGPPRRTHYRVDLPPGPAADGDARCCRRSRLRGAFLALGSVNRPDRPPHLEIPVRDEAAASLLVADLETLEGAATTRQRQDAPW